MVHYYIFNSFLYIRKRYLDSNIKPSNVYDDKVQIDLPDLCK